MFRKNYLILLLSSFIFLSGCSLMAMEDPNPDLRMHSRVPVKPISRFTFNIGNMEETIAAIDYFLQCNIEYNKSKKNILKRICAELTNKNYKKFDAEFKDFFGNELDENIDAMKLINLLMGFEEGINVYDTVIHNATTFRQDLYHKIGDEYKYPRNSVGAALISWAATTEQKDNVKYQQRLLKRADSISKYIFETICKEEMEFWSIIQSDLLPHYMIDHIKDPYKLRIACVTHNEAYKLKEDAIKVSSETAKRLTFDISDLNGFIAWKLKQSSKKKESIKVEISSGFSDPQEWVKHIKNPKKVARSKKKKGTTGKSNKVVKSPFQALPQKAAQTGSSCLAVLEGEAKGEFQFPVISDKNTVSKVITIESTGIPYVDLPSASSVNVDIEEDTHLFPYQPYVKPIAEVKPLSSPKLQLFKTDEVNKKYKELLKDIFSKAKNIDFDVVKNMMIHVFNAHESSFSSGKCHFDLYLFQKDGEPTQFVSKEVYLMYQKDPKYKAADYKIVRRTIVSEPPHSRGSHKQGQTRFMYPALVELLASSLERIGITPKNLGWE